jgi:hypothetical protein
MLINATFFMLTTHSHVPLGMTYPPIVA